ncbi:hypothetical protein ASJ35_17875 [Ruthenibacterium lactatiformans]|uniref:Uncharacterized protein n=1 Tax=Ruthenibacterium lactatiformans TaxID=1550024 RepID=A0A0W7TLP8_9FIRM|nr:hypothetical protein ASJ35_17875 [Ruthenibacterium lactatiformans]
MFARPAQVWAEKRVFRLFRQAGDSPCLKTIDAEKKPSPPFRRIDAGNHVFLRQRAFFFQSNTAQFQVSNRAGRFFCRLNKNAGEYFVYSPAFL